MKSGLHVIKINLNMPGLIWMIKINLKKNILKLFLPYLTTKKLNRVNGVLVDASAPAQLRVAAEAWNALYKSDESFNWKKKGHKVRIIEWIDEKYPNQFTNKAKDRIAQLINHNPHGGAPSA